jgi:hypothetical protein
VCRGIVQRDRAFVLLGVRSSVRCSLVAPPMLCRTSLPSSSSSQSLVRRPKSLLSPSPRRLQFVVDAVLICRRRRSSLVPSSCWGLVSLLSCAALVCQPQFQGASSPLHSAQLVVQFDSSRPSPLHPSKAPRLDSTLSSAASLTSRLRLVARRRRSSSPLCLSPSAVTVTVVAVVSSSSSDSLLLLLPQAYLAVHLTSPSTVAAALDRRGASLLFSSPPLEFALVRRRLRLLLCLARVCCASPVYAVHDWLSRSRLAAASAPHAVAVPPPLKHAASCRRVVADHRHAAPRRITKQPRQPRVSTSHERVWRHPACIARDMCAVCRPQSFRRHCRIAITVVVVIVISSPLMRPRQGSPLCASVQSSPGACRMCVPSLPSRLHESKSPLAAASTEASPHVVARRRSLLNVPLTTDSPSCAPHPRRLCVTRMSAGVCASSSRHRLDSSPCIFVVASFPVS